LTKMGCFFHGSFLSGTRLESGGVLARLLHALRYGVDNAKLPRLARAVKTNFKRKTGRIFNPETQAHASGFDRKARRECKRKKTETGNREPTQPTRKKF